MRRALPGYLGNLLVLVGFAVIAVAWQGAVGLAGEDRLLHSLAGGAGGVALIVAGMALVVVHTLRGGAARRARDMRRVQDEADALLRWVIRPRPGEVIDDRTVVDVRAGSVVRLIERRRAAAAASTLASGPAPDAVKSAAAADADAPADAAPDDHARWAPPAASPASAARTAFDAALGQVDATAEIDPVTRRSLYINFGTIAALRSASPAEISQATGIAEEHAQRISDAVRRHTP
jgi:hypothetical protein